MAYTIINADGTTLVTVPDTEVNTTYGVTLVGRNYAGYGTFLNDNFIALMENFNKPSAPASPLEGQLWYNPNTYSLSLWDDRAWKQLAFAVAQGTAPSASGRNVGDIWFDTDNQQLNVWTGVIVSNVIASLSTTTSTVSLLSSDSVRVGDILTTTSGTPITTAQNVVVTQILSTTTVQVNQAVTLASGQTVTFTRSSGWYLVGPAYSRTQQITGIYPKTVVDTNNITRTVGLIYQHGQVVGSISRDNEYALGPGYTIDRLPLIKPGITLISDQAPQQTRTVLSNSSIPAAGTTLVGISSVDGIQVGDYVITANVAYSQAVSVSAIFPANASITIGTSTVLATNDLITFQRGTVESSMFYGTATNAQALNGVTADRFATLAGVQKFQNDVYVAGNLWATGQTIIWDDDNGDIYLDNQTSGTDFSIYNKISGSTPSFSRTVQSTTAPADGYHTVLYLDRVDDLSMGDIIISANNQVGNLITINGVFNANSSVSINRADYFRSSEPVTFQRGINRRLRTLYVNGMYGNIEVAVDPTSNMGIATKRYVDLKANIALQATATNVAALIGTASISRRDFGNVSLVLDQFIENFTAVNAAVALRSTIDSPVFTGNPQAPTPSIGNSDTSIATTKFVTDTANIILASTTANAIVQDGQIMLRANITSPAFIGTPTAPNADFLARTQQLATTYWVGTQFDAININTTANLVAKAPLQNPQFTGVPTAPTTGNLSYTIIPGTTYSLNIPVSGGDSTVATTGFVANAIATMPSANLVPYATKVSPTLEGIPQSTNAPAGTANAWIATTRFVALNSPVLSVNSKTGTVTLGVADISGAAPIADPVFTGIPSAPEPDRATYNLQIPTTSWVGNIAANLAPRDNPVFTGVITMLTPNANSTASIATTCQWVNGRLASADVPKWGGATKYVSTNAPADGTGVNGDLWFQYTP